MRALVLAIVFLGCSGSGAPTIPCAVPVGDGTRRAPLPAPLVAPCDAQGWCWENPLPFRDSIRAIWHREDLTVLVSDRGHVLALRDGVWEALPPLPKPVGETDIPTINDIWAGGGRIYIAGGIRIEGVVWDYDGAAWTAHHFEDGFNPHHIWGTRADDVMTVGADGTRHYSGGAWTAPAAPGTRGQGVWGCGGVYFAGFFPSTDFDGERVVARFDGSSWGKTAVVPSDNVQFSAISGTSPTNVFAAGIINEASADIAWHFDGKTWTDLDLPDCVGLYDIVATGERQALATGLDSNGMARIWRYGGATWSIAFEDGMSRLSVATTKDVLGCSKQGVRQFDGESWFAPFPLPVDNPLNSKSFTGIWGDGAGALFLIARDGSIFERVGDSWLDMSAPVVAASAPLAIWGAAANDVFVVGERGLVLHWDGAAWTQMALPVMTNSTTLRAVWGVDGSHVFAVGDSGRIAGYDGTRWSDLESVAENLTGVWGTSATNVWAVGVRGLLVHFDGTVWDDSSRLPGDARDIAGIWGSGPTKIFVVGADNVYGYDGAAWTKTTLGTAVDAKAIWGRAADDVTLVGTNGMAFHFDGTAWKDIRAEHAWTFNAIFGDAAGLRAVGELGTISIR
jgi:hypothetical protein